MTDYHVRQMTGTRCAPYNCASASGAMAVAFGSGGKQQPTSDQFRTRSGVSCVPGEHSRSGGLFISDVERTAATYGVTIDYGRDAGGLKRWTAIEERDRLKAGFGMVCLGDYDQIPSWLDAQPGFNGDHSTFVHDYRASDTTVCWHDPLALKPRRVKWSVVTAYNQKAGSPVKGLAGFVRIVVTPPDTSTGDDMTKVYAVLGHKSAEWPAGATVYADATGTATAGTLPERRRLDIQGASDGTASPDRFLVDGAGDGVGQAGLMRWLRNKDRISGTTRDEIVAAHNAGVEAAAKAALGAKR